MLELHYHPLASYCWKALIALYETGTAFEPRTVDLGNPDARAAFIALWPTGMMPLLVDNGRAIPESSIIVEYIGRERLLPASFDDQLQARLWDRLFDTYVMTPMQAIVADTFRPEGAHDPVSVEKAQATLAMAYGMIDRHMQGREWAAGDAFGIADCAAFPSLFFAETLVPFLAGHAHLAAYFERLLERASVARTLDQAQPHLHFYPFHAAIAPRFLKPRSARRPD
jgi:glutathione S-transferase